MSTVRADNFSNRDGSLGSIPANTLLQGTAKAWGNLNGTGTIALRDSFNVASTVDNGVGDFSFNYTTAMPNANYAFNIGAGDTTISDAYVARRTASPLTTTAIRVFAQSASVGTLTDINEICLSITGDPA